MEFSERGRGKVTRLPGRLRRTDVSRRSRRFQSFSGTEGGTEVPPRGGAFKSLSGTEAGPGAQRISRAWSTPYRGDSAISVVHEPREPGPGELGAQPSESAGPAKSFVGRTLQAFGQALLRLGMHAVGLGPVYEVCHWANKAAKAVQGLLSDHGAELSLPVPVGGVDLMVSVTVGGENGEHSSPVSLFVAPGEDSLAAAVEIGPAEEDEESKHPVANQAALAPSEPVPAALAAEEPQRYGEVLIARMDLSALKQRSRTDRVAVLRELAERELVPRLAESHEKEDLALLIGYDPAMGLAFWTRTDPDSSRVWNVVAEYDTSTGRLVIKAIKEARPSAKSTTASDLPWSQPGIILRKE